MQGQRVPAERFGIHSNNRANKAVSAARQCFNESRLGSGIAKNLTNLVDCSPQAVIEVNEGVRGPKFPANLFACDEFPRTRQQHGQQLERLRLQPDSYPVLPKFARMQIRFVRTES